MGSSNVPPREQQATEQKFKALLHQFFSARGNLELRQKLVAQMRALRDQLCVSKEKFIAWFKKTFAVFLEVEREQTARSAMSAYRAHLVELSAPSVSPPTTHALQ